MISKVVEKPKKMMGIFLVKFLNPLSIMENGKNMVRNGIIALWKLS